MPWSLPAPASNKENVSLVLQFKKKEKMQEETRRLISPANKSVLNTEGIVGIARVGSLVRVHLKGTI